MKLTLYVTVRPRAHYDYTNGNQLVVESLRSSPPKPGTRIPLDARVLEVELDVPADLFRDPQYARVAVAVPLPEAPPAVTGRAAVAP